jgi:hypothetical protein
MLDMHAPGYELKAGANHRYKVHYAGKPPFFLDKGKGAATSNRSDRSTVEIRIQKVVAMVAQFGLCFRCVRNWFPDVKLPSDKSKEEERTYCPEHKTA